MGFLNNKHYQMRRPKVNGSSSSTISRFIERSVPWFIIMVELCLSITDGRCIEDFEWFETAESEIFEMDSADGSWRCPPTAVERLAKLAIFPKSLTLSECNVVSRWLCRSVCCSEGGGTAAISTPRGCWNAMWSLAASRRAFLKGSRDRWDVVRWREPNTFFCPLEERLFFNRRLLIVLCCTSLTMGHNVHVQR